MHRSRAKVLLALFVMLYLTGCNSQPSEQVSLPTPVPPPELAVLPREARIYCPYYPPPARDTEVVVWELPGIPTKDQESARYGDRGREIGTMRHCAPMTVTSYAWSGMDRQFWVLIQANGLKGWVWMSLVEFPPFSSPPPPP